ncbi:MAG: KGK domain-containing protein [Halothece sp.]
MADYKFLDDKDVVSFVGNSIFQKTVQIKEIRKKIDEWLYNHLQPQTGVNYFSQTFPNCEVLRQNGKGWKRGRIKVCFEFIPDEPEQVEEENNSDQGTLDEFRN